MAMLAEKRRKSKFVLTPVAKPLWTLETSQFGKKLMEKMGWAAGKGLGATEQGIHEPLRAVYKQDSKGMGYSGDGNPFENLDQFNALLASLSGEAPSENVVNESLEEKSKHSRSRVHYKKFTRGKDVSRYSNVDLSCIVGLGKKVVEEEVIEVEEIDHTGEEEHSHGVTTINSGSIADYFILKMKQKTDLRDTELATDNEGNVKDEAGLSGNKSCNIDEQFSKIDIPSKKSRKSRKNIDEDGSISPVNKNESSNKQQSVTECEPLKVKSKKKKKDKEKFFDDVEEKNIDYKLKVKKKSKKQKKKSTEVQEDDNFSDLSLIEVIHSEIKKTHKSKRRKEQDDPITLINCEEMNTICDENISVMEVNGSPCKNKKKHRNEKNYEISTDGLEMNSEIEHKPKKKKKKDKVKKNSDDGSENEGIVENYESKSEKKRKNKEKLEFETTTFKNCEDSSDKKKRKFLQDNDEKDYEESETKTKKIKNEIDENCVSIPSHEEHIKTSDEISSQFKGSNLGSLPGYGHRRSNHKGH